MRDPKSFPGPNDFSVCTVRFWTSQAWLSNFGTENSSIPDDVGKQTKNRHTDISVCVMTATERRKISGHQKN